MRSWSSSGGRLSTTPNNRTPGGAPMVFHCQHDSTVTSDRAGHSPASSRCAVLAAVVLVRGLLMFFGWGGVLSVSRKVFRRRHAWSASSRVLNTKEPLSVGRVFDEMTVPVRCSIGPPDIPTVPQLLEKRAMMEAIHSAAPLGGRLASHASSEYN
jgi:hypothetical protein